MRETRHGNPSAIASNTEPLAFSYISVGSTSASARARILRTSAGGWNPKNSTCAIPCSFTKARKAASSGPRPTTLIGNSGTNAAASRNFFTPFSGDKRPTYSTYPPPPDASSPETSVGFTAKRNFVRGNPQSSIFSFMNREGHKNMRTVFSYGWRAFTMPISRAASTFGKNPRLVHL
jgi:hypothetical protein